jgi:hypothetical protein
VRYFAQFDCLYKRWRISGPWGGDSGAVRQSASQACLIIGDFSADWMPGQPSLRRRLKVSAGRKPDAAWLAQAQDLDALWCVFTAQRFEQRREELDEGHHHQGEAGIQLTEGIFAAILFGLVL